MISGLISFCTCCKQCVFNIIRRKSVVPQWILIGYFTLKSTELRVIKLKCLFSWRHNTLYFYLRMDVFQGFLLFLSICLILFGVFGNFLVFLGAYKEKSLRNVPCMFVLNLSACHLIVLLFPFLVFVASFAVGEWPFSFAVCESQAYVSYSLGTEVMLTMVLLSVNRYCRILQPVQYRYIFSRRSTKCFIVVSWCVSFLVNIFPLHGRLRKVRI